MGNHWFEDTFGPRKLTYAEKMDRAARDRVRDAQAARDRENNRTWERKVAYDTERDRQFAERQAESERDFADRERRWEEHTEQRDWYFRNQAHKKGTFEAEMHLARLEQRAPLYRSPEDVPDLERPLTRDEMVLDLVIQGVGFLGRKYRERQERARAIRQSIPPTAPGNPLLPGAPPQGAVPPPPAYSPQHPPLQPQAGRAWAGTSHPLRPPMKIAPIVWLVLGGLFGVPIAAEAILAAVLPLIGYEGANALGNIVALGLEAAIVCGIVHLVLMHRAQGDLTLIARAQRWNPLRVARSILSSVRNRWSPRAASINRTARRGQGGAD